MNMHFKKFTLWHGLLRQLSISMTSYTYEEHIFCGHFDSSEHFFLPICGEGGQCDQKPHLPYPAIPAPVPFPATSCPGWAKLPLNLMSFCYCIFLLWLTSRPLPPSFESLFPPSPIPFSVSPTFPYSPGFLPPCPSPLRWWCVPTSVKQQWQRICTRRTQGFKTYAQILMPCLF